MVFIICVHHNLVSGRDFRCVFHQYGITVFYVVGRIFYGPGGPYHLFAGKDASRALAKMSFEEKDLTGDISGLGVFELEALQDWEYKFMSKYVKVGTLKKSEATTEGSTERGEAAETYGEVTDGGEAAEIYGEVAETSGETNTTEVKKPVEASDRDIAAPPPPPHVENENGGEGGAGDEKIEKKVEGDAEKKE